MTANSRTRRRTARTFLAALSVLAGLLVSSVCRSGRPADLILTNAAVHTMDALRPRAEAVAVGGGKVVFVGSARQAGRFRGR